MSDAGFFLIMCVVVVIGIWLLLLPASIARRKGSSWLGFFLLSIFGLWLVALIWAYFILEDKSVENS